MANILKIFGLMIVFIIGASHSFATVSHVRSIEKKVKIEVSAISIDYALSDFVFCGVDSFNFTEAYQAILYLNQARSIKAGYNVSYGGYSEAQISKNRYRSSCRSNC